MRQQKGIVWKEAKIMLLVSVLSQRCIYSR